MSQEKEIVEQIDQLNTFKLLTQAYTEIAALRMKKIRDTVLANREYLSNLDDVFTDVRVSYARDVLKLGKISTKSSDKITFLSHNGKTVGVFLSANTGLYGDIISKTFDMFIKEVKSEDLEVTIVGRLGEQMFKNSGIKEEYTYFELSDKKIEHEQLADILKHLVQYEEIRVYYPTFHSAVSQKPTKYTISAQTPISEINKRSDKRSQYLFEPSLKEILVFFEKEIFASLLDQSIRESQLAKFAARIMTLDRAGENIKRRVKNLQSERLRISHRIANKKQSERMVSLFK